MTSFFNFTKDLTVSDFLNHFPHLIVLCEFTNPFKFLFRIVQHYVKMDKALARLGNIRFACFFTQIHLIKLSPTQISNQFLLL